MADVGVYALRPNDPNRPPHGALAAQGPTVQTVFMRLLGRPVAALVRLPRWVEPIPGGRC